MPTYQIAQGNQFHGSARIEKQVNRRLPNPVRWSRKTRSLVSDGIAPEDLPTLTGKDIDWTGLDQRLGEESSLTVAAAILIEEMETADIAGTTIAYTTERGRYGQRTVHEVSTRAFFDSEDQNWRFLSEGVIYDIGVGGAVLGSHSIEDTAELWGDEPPSIADLDAATTDLYDGFDDLTEDPDWLAA